MRLLNTDYQRVMEMYDWLYECCEWVRRAANEARWPRLFFRAVEAECRAGTIAPPDRCGFSLIMPSVTLYWDRPDRVLELKKTGAAMLFRCQRCRFEKVDLGEKPRQLLARFRALAVETAKR